MIHYGQLPISAFLYVLRPHLNVIAFFLSSRIGLSSPSNPVNIFCSANSGNHVATSSSRPIKPLSTHWSAAMLVKSFVWEARKKQASSLIGPSVPRIWAPAAWE